MKDNKELQRIEKVNLATANQWTEEQISIIKATVAKNTTDTELAYFLNLAKSLNLNPFNKEIWCYKSGTSLMAFAGRDGFLKIAQSNRLWNGITSAEVRENDVFEVDIPNGKITHKPNFKNKGKILLAYCYIKPKGCETATIEIADFDTYNKGVNVWKSHPADMIKKVAEIKALKKAFGIAGLYDENDFSIQNDKAIAIDTENGVDMQTYAYIEKLLSTSTLDHEERHLIDKELENGIYISRSDELIEYLKLNQQDSTQTGKMNAGDIQNQLELKMQDPNA
jgi:phage recombination protein Bet